MFVKKTTLNKDEIPFPVQLERTDLYEDRSFIRLLFDDDWPATHNHYYICYHERACKENWPAIVQTRANIYPRTSSYWVACDCTASFAINIFNLGSEEVSMLDQLLIYRLNPCTYSLTINYSTLTSNLGKMIWIYLNFKVNEEYSKIDTTTPIASSDNTLENMYECYIIENVFSFVQGLGR
jgi:hypothetical protein